MTVLRLPYFAGAPMARRTPPVRAALRVQRRATSKIGPRRRETADAVGRLLHLGRDLLMALWAAASLAFCIVVLAGWVLG
jgi:hypothetical protein